MPRPSCRGSGCYDGMMRLALDPFRLLLVSLAGWLNQQQQDVIDYLQEENRVLRDQLGGKRLRFNDDQRRRLAVRAKKLGRRMLHSFDDHRDAGNALGLASQADRQEISWQPAAWARSSTCARRDPAFGNPHG